MANSWRYRNPIRIGFQLVVLGLIGYVAIRPLFGGGYVADFEAYCPFGGLSSFMSRLNKGTMSCTMSEVQVMLGFGLLLGVLAVGKLFCSHLCPIGSITEWLGKLGMKWKILREMPARIDRPLRLLKYALLFVTVYFTMTSSELFCKEYDPYFAAVNLFQNTDIVLYFAIPATVLAVLGAIFFRLFWCKYLCPLGALSNIFLNVAGAAAVIGGFILANLLGAGLGYIWLVGGLVLVGAATEIGFLRSYLLPAAKITRSAELCTDCGMCEEKCPQGIAISKYAAVTHTDCNLCTDCVYACPLKNTLSIVNQKRSFRYLAPAATVLLVALSLGASRGFEFTTIEERWGGFDSIKTIQTYQLSGLKNVKCYGSSMSVKQKLESVPGIYGLDTYASSHTVRVYYNPAEITEARVKSSLFTSSKQRVRNLKKGEVDSLGVWEVGIYRLFDLIDFNNLAYALKNDPGVAGFETRFGEPVMTRIYFDRAKTTPAAIKALIEAREVVAKKPTGDERLELDFSCENAGRDLGSMDVASYERLIFRPYDREFNGYEEYTPQQLRVWVFSMPEADAAPLRRYFGSLSSHLSADDGVVRFSTRYMDGPAGLVFFDPSKTTADKIRAALVKPILTVFRTETETQDMPNPFHIPLEGNEKKAIDLRLDDER
jgi:polyferredoxin